ncbi:helix-turn-helix transcriptional regulator [Haloechinothrix sp. YIM 98757]|uniref:Helix-turn-helix transcriptional regulator n=1 Tax=Haloechinothrix aidingensis TaxID=2752311 RepID=A0A838AAR5_9PSEU|nr:helix-turn-helix transcriptional regulator [Haloechinothrix aidingensis]MBA0126323.1 helix-turn-helix transcriptional regulator [Haloechinothrix aidingensis]
MRTAKVDGDKLRQARELAGYTQESIAKRLELNRSAIAHWESTDPSRQPLGRHFKRLCKLLEVDPSSLLLDEGDRDEAA